MRVIVLQELHGRKAIEGWSDAARAGRFDALVDELLMRHYDPTYARSIQANFPRSAEAIDVHVSSIAPDGMRKLAAEVIAAVSTKELA
jgi:tRNA 2-selenouridine synthase